MQFSNCDEFLMWFHTNLQIIDRIFQKHNMSITFYLISQILFDNDKVNVKQISQKLNLSLSSTTQILNRMEKNKFIKRIQYNLDRRVIYVELTMNGKMAYKSSRIAITSHIQQLLNKQK